VVGRKGSGGNLVARGKGKIKFSSWDRRLAEDGMFPLEESLLYFVEKKIGEECVSEKGDNSASSSGTGLKPPRRKVKNWSTEGKDD